MTTAIVSTPAPLARITGGRCPTLPTGTHVRVIEVHAASVPGRSDSVTVRTLDGHRRVVMATYLDVLPIPAAADGREYFNAVFVDHWVCPCGNVPDQAGLYFVDRAGADIGDDDAAWNRDGRCYGCADCGRFGAQRERDPMGRVLVIGTAEHLPTGEPVAATT